MLRRQFETTGRCREIRRARSNTDTGGRTAITVDVLRGALAELKIARRSVDGISHDARRSGLRIILRNNPRFDAVFLGRGRRRDHVEQFLARLHRGFSLARDILQPLLSHPFGAAEGQVHRWCYAADITRHHAGAFLKQIQRNEVAVHAPARARGLTC